MSEILTEARGAELPTRPKERSFWRTAFGPGLLWAAAAIGVSHLVQSTRAGQAAGFSLVWVVLLALALKYPFFEYGPRYAAAAGESLVEGYARLGRWAVWVYFLITISTAVVIQATVTLFTAFLFGYLVGAELPMAVVGALVLSACGALLAVGRFPALDYAIKAVLAALTVCTLVAAAITLPRAAEVSWTPWPLGPSGATITFAFILALVGWMPSAIDISVWSSLWTLAKDRAAGARSSVAEALLDFRIGYVGTGIIAFAFLTLGATVMHASGQSFSPEGAVFSIQLVDLYAATLGEWSRPLILVAAITTMFSTVLAVMDGFPRAIARTLHVLRSRAPEPSGSRRGDGATYWIVLVVLAALTVAVLAYFTGNMTTMVDFATIVSFLTAPVLGYLNLRVITSSSVPAEFQPGPGLRLFSYLGLLLLGGTALVYALTRFL